MSRTVLDWARQVMPEMFADIRVVELARQLADQNALVADLQATIRAGDARIAELEMALGGLLALAEKMWGYLRIAVDAGIAIQSPANANFSDLIFVKKSRAALAGKGVSRG